MTRRQRPPAEGANTTDKLRQRAPERGPDLSDPDQGPPEEPGVSIEPMETGVQFLRDATEQYNFESSVNPADDELSGVPLGQLISDATLESANQTDFEVPMSAALSEDDDDALTEPEEPEIDLRSNAIVAGSLFDQPVSNVDAEEEEREAEDDFAATLAAPLRSPQVVTDDPSDIDDDRLEEIQRQLDERVKNLIRVEVLPGKAEHGRKS